MTLKTYSIRGINSSRGGRDTTHTTIRMGVISSIGGSNIRDTIHGRKVNSSENTSSTLGATAAQKTTGTYRDARNVG
jgi:hypothetical protein